MAIKKYKKQDEVSYCLGITLTFELLINRPDLAQKVYYHSKFEINETYYELEKLCKIHHIPFEQNDKAFNILSDKENCFVIGEFRKFFTELEKCASHIVLVNPSNAGNLGTIIRTAVGFGIRNLAIIKPATDIFDPKTIRASMGSLFHLQFSYYESFIDYRNQFSDRHMYLFMLKGSNSLSDGRINGLYSLVFGNEATGLPDDYSEYGKTIRIVHSDKIDSLNLPIAVSIALYEATKDNFR